MLFLKTTVKRSGAVEIESRVRIPEVLFTLLLSKWAELIICLLASGQLTCYFYELAS